MAKKISAVHPLFLLFRIHGGYLRPDHRILCCQWIRHRFSGEYIPHQTKNLLRNPKWNWQKDVMFTLPLKRIQVITFIEQYK